MKLEIRNFFRYVLDTIFPVTCLGCNAEGEWLCEPCRRSVQLKEQLTCPLCEKAARYGLCCDRCRTTNGLDGILVAGDYHDALLQRAIKTLKYRFIAGICEGLGRLLARRAMDNIQLMSITGWVSEVRQPR